jgi:Rod binding domain-containing protein
MSSVSEISAGVATQSLLDSRTDQLTATARSKPADTKLTGYAHKFEAILIGKWLEEAEASFAKLPGDDQDADADPGQDQFRSMTLQFLAEGISSKGGLGIGSMILKHLQKDRDNSHAADNKAANPGGPSAPPAPTAGASTNDY